MKRLTYPLAAIVVIVATTLAPSAAAANGADRHNHGRKCVSLRPDFGFYEAGRVATEVLTVPRSRCRTISVSHIKDPANRSDRCQTFLVGFYPLIDGSLTYTEPVTACGRHRTVLARNVPNATRYIVLYQVDYLEQRIRFKVHH
jgi:hypothetical protein